MDLLQKVCQSFQRFGILSRTLWVVQFKIGHGRSEPEHTHRVWWIIHGKSMNEQMTPANRTVFSTWWKYNSFLVLLSFLPCILCQILLHRNEMHAAKADFNEKLVCNREAPLRHPLAAKTTFQTLRFDKLFFPFCFREIEKKTMDFSFAISI